jgi:hypothetical protein
LGLGSVVIATVTGILVACTGDDTVVTGNNDAGTDSGSPAPTTTTTGQDSGPPVGDGGVVTVDAALEAGSYGELVGETMCNALTKCCFNNPNVAQGGAVDGGTFNRSVCTALYDKLGFERSNFGLQVTHDSVSVDPAKASDCLTKLANLSCQLTSAELKAAREACFDSLVGQLEAGAPCQASIQCAKDTFCFKPDAGDAGGVTGSCVALRGQGHACGDVQVTSTDINSNEIVDDSNAAEEACSWRGGGDTNLACASVDPVSGAYKADRAGWTCQTPVPDGGFCNTSVSCVDGICDTATFTCVPVLQYFNANACTNFRQ